MHIVTPPAPPEFAQRIAHLQAAQRALAAHQVQTLVQRAKQPAPQKEQVPA